MDKKEEFEAKIASIMRDDVADLAGTAGILASWMTEQEYTIAEQLVILELIRATILTAYTSSVIRQELEKVRAKPRRSPPAGMWMGSMS